MHINLPSNGPVIAPRALRKRTAAVLEFIQAEVAAGRPFPRPAAIAARMGWSSQSAADCLIGLAASGHIRKIGSEPRTQRALYVLAESAPGDPSESTVPGAASAGPRSKAGAGVGNGGLS